ncbi:MAG: arginine repressor [Planctomycetota bacterium]
MQRPLRLELLRSLLSSQAVPTQEALLRGLQERGVRVTQATLSRDLREIGAVKSADGYRLLGEARGVASSVVGLIATGSLTRAVQGHLTGAKPGVGLVVCTTSPGHAQVLALELDRTPPPGVLGTVGGDDTVFVAVDRPERAESLTVELLDMAGLERTGAAL